MREIKSYAYDDHEKVILKAFRSSMSVKITLGKQTLKRDLSRMKGRNRYIIDKFNFNEVYKQWQYQRVHHKDVSSCF